MHDREIWLAEAMIELADSLNVHEPTYLHLLMRRLSGLAAPAEIGLLLTTETGSLTTATAGTNRMHRLLSVESRFSEGPCTTCHGTGQRLPPQSLAGVDARWPRFGPAAREAGFGSVAALPIRRNAETLGAVSILDATPRPAAELELDLIGVLVEAAAIGLVHQQTLRQSARRSEHLQRALDSRVLIEQAKGIIAAKNDITPDVAFEHLRNHARRNGRRLSDIAEAMVQGRISDDELAGSQARKGGA